MPPVYWTAAGEYRQLITTQAKTLQDGQFGATEVWNNVLVNYPAKIEPMGGSEQFKAGQFTPESLYTIKIRHPQNAGLTPDALTRIVLQNGGRAAFVSATDSGATILDILNVSDLLSMNRELLLTCKERVKQAAGEQ